MPILYWSFAVFVGVCVLGYCALVASFVRDGQHNSKRSAER